MAAPLKNRFAAKPPEERHVETLFVRLTKLDKDRIVRAAGDVGLTSWAREVLLRAARRHGHEKGEQTGSSEPREKVPVPIQASLARGR